MNNININMNNHIDDNIVFFCSYSTMTNSTMIAKASLVAGGPSSSYSSYSSHYSYSSSLP